MIERDKKMQNMIDGLSKTLFGRSQAECSALRTCVICGGDATSFRDAVSAREYEISGMCQKCQDETFGTHTNQ
jgi:hypothetical protein